MNGRTDKQVDGGTDGELDGWLTEQRRDREKASQPKNGARKTHILSEEKS